MTKSQRWFSLEHRRGVLGVEGVVFSFWAISELLEVALVGVIGGGGVAIELIRY